VVSPLQRVLGLVHAGVRHVETNPLPEGTGDGVGGVDPAVRVQHVLGNVLGVNAVDGVADVLLGRHDQGEGEHAGRGHAVVQPEHPRVYVHVGHVEQPAELAEYFQHGFCFLFRSTVRRRSRKPNLSRSEAPLFFQ